MQKVVLLSRLAAGYDTDRFIFEYDGKRIKKYYGSRLTDLQAKSQLLIDLGGKSYDEGGIIRAVSGSKGHGRRN